MAHYAVVNEENKVINVIRFHDHDCEDLDGNEICDKVDKIRDDLYGTDWTGKLIKTSFHGNIHGKYAAVGDTWSEEHNRFIPKQPEDYYTLDTNTFTWVPPGKPTRTQYEIDNHIDYRWHDFKYNTGSPAEDCWFMIYTGTFPDVPEGQSGRYVWNRNDYVEGDVSTGFMFVEDEPVGIAST